MRMDMPPADILRQHPISLEAAQDPERESETKAPAIVPGRTD